MLKAVEADTLVAAKQRYVALDGLRGVAAYMVVISHYIGSDYKGAGLTILAPLHLAGQVGVMLFFVISGFLMGELYMQTPCTKENVRAFYVKRIARVVPLFYLIVLVSFTLFVARHNVWPLYYVDRLWPFMLFWNGGNNVLWTIPVEVQFYAVFPLIWWAFSKAGNAIMILLIIICATIGASGATTPALFNSFLPFFAAGLLLSVVEIPYSRLMEFLTIPAFALLIIGLPEVSTAMGFKPTGLWSSPFYLALVPTTVLLIVKSRLAGIVLGSKIATFAGAISYSVYLLHMPTHFVLRQLPFYDTAPLLFICVALVGATVVAWLSYRFIENPARRWVSRFASARVTRRHSRRGVIELATDTPARSHGDGNRCSCPDLS